MSDSREARDEHTFCDPTVMDAVRSNTDLLHTLLAQLTDVQMLVDASGCAEQKSGAEEGSDPRFQANDSEWKAESGRLRQKIQRLESENSELHSQNEELAAKIAASKIQETALENSFEAGEMLS